MPETEAEAARSIRAMGVQNVIITLGSRGRISATTGSTKRFRRRKCGRSIRRQPGTYSTGRWSSRCPKGKSLEEAVRFASRASAISVTRMGRSRRFRIATKSIVSFRSMSNF